MRSVATKERGILSSGFSRSIQTGVGTRRRSMFQPMQWTMRIGFALLAVGVFVPQAKSATLQNLEVSTVAVTTCTPPPATTSFSVTDGNMYEYFVLLGLKVGDQV